MHDKIIGVDPGVGYCGYALLWGDLRAYYSDSLFDLKSFLKSFADSDTIFVIEVPTLRSASPVKKSNILDLSYSAGFYAGLAAAHGCVIETVTPAAWKGSVPKKVHQARLIEKHPEILQAVMKHIPKSKQEHAVDACGLAYWYQECHGR